MVGLKEFIVNDKGTKPSEDYQLSNHKKHLMKFTYYKTSILINKASMCYRKYSRSILINKAFSNVDFTAWTQRCKKNQTEPNFTTKTEQGRKKVFMGLSRGRSSNDFKIYRRIQSSYRETFVSSRELRTSDSIVWFKGV